MGNQDFEKKIGDGLEQLGNSLVNLADTVIQKLDGLLNKLAFSSVKGSYEDRLVAYFVAKADKENVSDMTMQNVFNWIDDNYPKLSNADKVYIVKGNNADNEIVLCAFFGQDDEVFINEEHPKKCFITSDLNDEMKQTFNDNNVCVIPLNK